MRTKKDQVSLEEMYNSVSPTHVGSPSALLGGKPVMITMDMPGAEIDHDESEGSGCDVQSKIDKLTDIIKCASHCIDVLNNGDDIDLKSQCLDDIIHKLKPEHDMFTAGAENILDAF